VKSRCKFPQGLPACSVALPNPLCRSVSKQRVFALQAGCRWFETGIGHHNNPLDVLQAAVLDAREPRPNSITPASLKARRGEPLGFEGITGAVARAAGEEARDRTRTAKGSFSLWLRPSSRPSSWTRPAC
jgi:hypothetical protein